ncbi:hypothetical protein DLM46_16705 [Paraburkholderia lacunae]|uniref:Uncharacterized protein n=1 Tax=Paraburkholderia lacunae TaxID=2211104 RepID=A0A370N781_9BURK|nr:hypothetical protein DLM46_16705 [Paraburkholderia lacunae]
MAQTSQQSMHTQPGRSGAQVYHRRDARYIDGVLVVRRGDIDNQPMLSRSGVRTIRIWAIYSI